MVTQVVHRAQEPETTLLRVAPTIEKHEQDLAPLTAQELTAADKHASQQFQATFQPMVGFLVAVLLVTVALAAGDPAVRTWTTVSVPALTTLIFFRTWLHWMDDQQQARLLFGYGAIGITTINHIGRYANADGHTSATAFFCCRAVMALVVAFYGYSGLSISHRVACTAIVAGASLVHPPLSEIGRPLEPILTCSALLLGTLLGLSIESYLIGHSKRGSPRADLPNAPAPTLELTAADEQTFVLQQFQAAFRPLVGFLVAVVLVCAGLGVGDPASRSRVTVGVLLFISMISLRTWLHWMNDQQRARLLFGHATIVLMTITQVGIYASVASGDGLYAKGSTLNAATFLFFRVMLALFVTFVGGYSASPITHRFAVDAIIAAASPCMPTLSEIGRPLEPILTCSAMVLGEAVGFAIETSLWMSFKEEQAEKRLRQEAQRNARETEERQRAAEADGVASKLATAKANRTADSQLNHMIKGLCGSALNWLDLIKAGGNGELCTSHAQCSIDLLKSAIEWTHRRQMLVSLADGTYMSRRSECHLSFFLAEKLTAGEGTVQVWFTPLLLCAL